MSQLNDETFVKEFGRLLISKNPKRRTLLTLFQHLKLYTLSGRDVYWKRYSPLLEETLPDSQGKFWDYQYHYEKYTHPSRRLEPGPNADYPLKEEEDLLPLSKEEEEMLALLLDK
jgi:hypothetical protein